MGAVIGLDGSKDGFSMARSACIIESRRSKGVSRELVWNSVPQAGEPDSSVEGCGAPAPVAAHSCGIGSLGRLIQINARRRPFGVRPAHDAVSSARCPADWLRGGTVKLALTSLAQLLGHLLRKKAQKPARTARKSCT